MSAYFGLLRRACGLSQSESAAYLDVRPDTVKSWERTHGPNACPAGVIDKMCELYIRIDAAARALIETIEDLARTGVRPEDRIAATATDEQARQRGWPCSAPYNMMIAIAYALSECDFTINPQGNPR